MFHKKVIQWYIFPFFLIISFGLYLIFIKNDGLYGNKSNLLSVKDTLKNQPKIEVRVNKKYDEQGNLIQYDSSYSIIYSTPEMLFYRGNSDSIMAHFRHFFGNDNFFSDDFFYNNLHNFDFDNNIFNQNPIEKIKRLQERINKLHDFQDIDSLFFNKQSQPNLKSQPQNMITL